jgi:hypothetical protein
VPRHDFLEDALAARLNNISMARNDALKVPLIDLGYTPRKTSAILGANSIPYQPLLPFAVGVRYCAEEFRKDAARRNFPGSTILLRRRVVEHKIRLY